MVEWGWSHFVKWFFSRRRCLESVHSVGRCSSEKGEWDKGWIWRAATSDSKAHTTITNWWSFSGGKNPNAEETVEEFEQIAVHPKWLFTPLNMYAGCLMTLAVWLFALFSCPDWIMYTSQMNANYVWNDLRVPRSIWGETTILAKATNWSLERT